ncbi:MAG: DNA-3-methyladenine glycosylase [Marinicellaceae bacterium]
MKKILKIKQPNHFRFDACLNFLDRGYDECLYQVNKTSVLRLIRLSSGLMLIQVESDAAFLIVSSNSEVTDTDICEIRDYVDDWFDVSRDISQFYYLLNKDKITQDFPNKYYGLRLMGIVDLFEALCWCVIGQQINLTFAHKIKSRLVHEYGDKIQYKGNDYYCFPTPEVLVNAATQDLVGMQFSKQKIAYTQNIARAFCDGEFVKTDLLKMTKNQQMEKLLAIKGIGPWTANYVSMKSLRNMSCIAYGDTGLSSALHNLYGTEKKPNNQTIDMIFKPFSGWESYFNFYLWKTLS